MNNKSINGLLTLFLMSTLFVSCNDERALYEVPNNFVAEVTDYTAMANDTVIVNANQPLTFKFPNGCPDQILYYSGESGKEYRFANRSLYRAEDGTQFESKITLATTINLFDLAVPSDYSLYAVSAFNPVTVEKFNAAPKTQLIKLRAGSTVSTSVTDNYSITSSSSALNLGAGDINIAICAKSADATKNMLSISATALLITNNETRNYGYVRNGVTVTNTKVLSYPITSTTISSAAFAQYAPDSTAAPLQTQKVANATGYSWNMGEIGVNYAPTVTGGNTSINKNGVALATGYPVSVVAPLGANQIVSPATSPSESWLIARAYNPCAVLSDAATVVKRVDQSSITFYQYVYKEKGIYTASFVGYNVGTNGTANVVRKFTIIVQ